MRAPILFNPALGFPGRVYNLFLNYIRNSSFPVEYVNVYAEGKAIEKLPHWEVLVEECINNATKAAAAHSSSKVIGLGHSFGGSLHMIAATRRPDLYERVILLDSPMFGTPTRVVLAAASMLKQTHRIIPQTIMARRKRKHFTSRSEAHAHYRNRGMFAEMHPQMFEDFIAHGLKDAVEETGGAKGLTLAFPPELEAAIFQATPHDLYPPYMGLYNRCKVPGNFLYSDKFDLIAKRDVQELSWVHRNIKFSPVSGGHFFPLTRPEYAAEKILEILDNPPN